MAKEVVDIGPVVARAAEVVVVEQSITVHKVTVN